MKKKNIILLLMLSCFIMCFVSGCVLKKDNKQITQEEVNKASKKIENIENKELEVINKIAFSDEDKEQLDEKINQNIENNVTSTSMDGKYFLSNGETTVKINVSNPITKNNSTEGDYGSLFLDTINNEIIEKVFYTFVNLNEQDDLIKKVAEAYVETNVTNITINESLFPTNLDNHITYVYDIECTDELGATFYGNAIVYSVNEQDNILCVIMSTIPNDMFDISFLCNNYINIE